MKLSTKIILPIILISALLILLNGCFGVPADESPGYTPGTITGIIAAPCCKVSVESAEGETTSPEYWCYYCQETWSLQDGVEVVLTYGEVKVATTTTNDKGEFTFTNVSPGKNYVITAYCPDYDDNRPLVKDVALEVASTFDTKTTDLVSTSLGLVVDFLVLYTEWGPEDISLDEVLADRPGFPNFPDFKALVYEVRGIEENCELNLHTDADVLYATCLAAEEISGLDIGCEAGFAPATPGPTPTPTDPCEGNNPPYDVSLVVPFPSVVVGETYSGTVTAKDDDVGDTLTYSLTEGFPQPAGMTITSAGVITWIPGCEHICGCGAQLVDMVRLETNGGCTPNMFKVTVDDGCDPVDAEFCIEVTNDIPAIEPISNQSVCCTATFTQVVTVTDADVPDYQTLTFTLDAASIARGMSIAKTGDTTAKITWIPGCEDVCVCASLGNDLVNGQINHVFVLECPDITVTVSDGCTTDTETFCVTVNNQKPVIASISDASVCCTATLTQEVSVTDADVPGCQTLYFDLDQDSFDRGMSIDKTNHKTAEITWIPGCSDVGGPYEVTVKVYDGCCEPVQESFFVTVVNDEPEIISLAPITLDLGNEYVYDIVVEDYDVCPEGCQTLAFALIEGPEGMEIDDDYGDLCEAQLTWFPECADLTWEQVCTGGECSNLYKSVMPVEIKVHDGCCDPVYKEFDITVYTSNTPPEIHVRCIPDEVCNGSTYCFELEASDVDSENLTWELFETNAGGVVYISDVYTNYTTLCWEPANCEPVMKQRQNETPHPDELCTRYFIVRVYDDGCPELYDEFCFDVIVRDCPPLHLYEKDSNWEIVGGGAEGLMTYTRSGYTFDFVFNGQGLEIGLEYCLIYYVDPGPGPWSEPPDIICLGMGMAVNGGEVHIAGSVDTGDLPAIGDVNYPTGAKIWLVLSEDVDCTTEKMVGWNPAEYLFENNLITFEDIDD